MLPIIHQQLILSNALPKSPYSLLTSHEIPTLCPSLGHSWFPTPIPIHPPPSFALLGPLQCATSTQPHRFPRFFNSFTLKHACQLLTGLGVPLSSKSSPPDFLFIFCERNLKTEKQKPVSRLPKISSRGLFNSNCHKQIKDFKHQKQRNITVRGTLDQHPEKTIRIHSPHHQHSTGVRKDNHTLHSSASSQIKFLSFSPRSIEEGHEPASGEKYFINCWINIRNQRKKEEHHQKLELVGKK